MITKRFYGVPSTFGWRDRFDELDYLWKRLNNVMGQDRDQVYRVSSPGVFPLVNLTEDAGNYYLRAELPGLTGADLDIQTIHNNVTISGERKLPEEDANVKFHRKERDSGKFSRIVKLPGEIDSEKIQARLIDGILTVTIAKAEKARPKQIKIQ